jgi:hypothetical protein
MLGQIADLLSGAESPLSDGVSILVRDGERHRTARGGLDSAGPGSLVHGSRNVLGVVVLVFSLVFHSAVHITGRQLLFSGGAAWFTNAIAFGLAFWELDCGGPVARALATASRKPDFQFPQDENAQLAREG